MLSGILTEMFFRIRAENFGPLAAKFFPFVGDAGCRTGMSAFRPIASSYLPTGDLRWPMSVIVPISSALPLKADVAAVGPESPKLTQGCHR